VNVYHQYTIRVVDQDRDAFADEIGKRGIGSGVYYPIPNHRLPSYGLTMDLPETELAAKQALSLPVHPSLSQSDLEKIVEVVNAVASAGA
jgi:dTDP-4-amino-4,6-dideoxygalactose transaminase